MNPRKSPSQKPFFLFLSSVNFICNDLGLYYYIYMQEYKNKQCWNKIQKRKWPSKDEWCFSCCWFFTLSSAHFLVRMVDLRQLCLCPSPLMTQVLEALQIVLAWKLNKLSWRRQGHVSNKHKPVSSQSMISIFCLFGCGGGPINRTISS